MNANRKAFLDTIAHSELGAKLLANSDDGYNVIVGGTLFHDYSRHPNVRVYLPKLKIHSTAAGRYQLLYRYWLHYTKALNLVGFGKDVQDTIALQLIRECDALDAIDAGHFTSAITKCKSRWASLPGAGYSQHENNIESLKMAYLTAGGVIV